MQALPFSLQSFSKLRKLNCLYVDKTKYAYDLILQEQSFFLARPRRFGKSIFISTLKEILKGNKDLFEGLFIAKTDYTWPIYGVIHLDFGPIKSTNAATVEKSLCEMLLNIAKDYKVSLSTDFTDSNSTLTGLTRALFEKFEKVAILIDEYDHPILQVLQDPQVIEVRTVLQSFLSTVKSLNEKVDFLFITGVSMFSKAGVFSGMNNPLNISLDPEFAGICGYTDEEIDHYFTEHIEAWAKKEKKPVEKIREQLRAWYNGYKFSEEPLSVYNPFSIIHALKRKQLQNFWFETGSPSFVIKELQKKHRQDELALFDLENFKVSSGLLGTIDIDTIPLPTLLFQTGYLTLSEYDPEANNYKLAFPNQEVKTALNQHLLTLITTIDAPAANYFSSELKPLLDRGDIAGAVSCLKTLFSHVPYQLHIAKEQFYHSLLQVACYAAGLKVQSEYSTSHARIDLVLELPSKFYVIEVKFNESAEVALAQIEERRYYEPFLAFKKPITLLGLSFTKKPSDFTITYVTKEI